MDNKQLPFEQQMAAYHRMLNEAIKNLSLAKTYAEDGAPYGASVHAAKAAEIFLAANAARNYALASITVKK